MTEVDLGAQAFWLLAAAGFASGVASLWAFRRWSDSAQLRAALNRIVAHLFELRLFSEEPALVLRAQRDLLLANGAFLRQVTGPSLFLLVPFAILLAALDAFFAHAPLQLGRAAVVTVECSPGQALSDVRLSAPAGMQIETPPVRALAVSQISWRLRPLLAANGYLQLRYRNRVIRKSISSANGLQWLSDSRAGSLLGFLLQPLEPPFADIGVNSIAVDYPAATIFNMPWPLWFSLAFACGTLIYSLAIYRR